MLGKQRTTIFTLLAGLALGAASGYLSKSSPRATEPVTRATPDFDEKRFAHAEATDSSLMLAQQLPYADAQKCAALAKTMLAKRIIYEIATDPFATNSPIETRESPLPPKAWEGLFKRWMQVAPQAAWDFLKAHEEELPLREAALRQWALIDPSAAVRAAGAEITTDEQEVILKACAKSDPALGLKLVTEWNIDLSDADVDPFGVDGTAIPNLLTELAKKSPAAAIEWCQANAPDLLSAVCIGWNHNDPKACLQWIQTLPTKQQQDIMTELCDQPDVSASSLRHLASLCEQHQVRNAMQNGLYQIAKNHEALSQQLIDEFFTNPADRMQLRADIGDSLRESDPRKAMNFILPSLRTSLPLFKIPAARYMGCGLGGGFFPPDNNGQYSSMAYIFNDYLALGPNAGVGKKEALATLREIHPQFVPWMLQENFSELREILGSPAQWAQEFYSKQAHEAFSNIIMYMDYSTSDAALQDVKSLSAGPLRDLIIERWIEIELENEATDATIMEQLSNYPDSQVDFSTFYRHWIDSAPEAALKHFTNNPHATSDEWAGIIDRGYKEHAQKIQNMADALPAGELRNSVAIALSKTSLEDHTDYTTSMYWATEIGVKKDRAAQMGSILEKWQADDDALQNAALIEGVRSNITHSPLSDTEKALWLERIESEVLR